MEMGMEKKISLMMKRKAYTQYAKTEQSAVNNIEVNCVLKLVSFKPPTSGRSGLIHTP